MLDSLQDSGKGDAWNVLIIILGIREQGCYKHKTLKTNTYVRIYDAQKLRYGVATDDNGKLQSVNRQNNRTPQGKVWKWELENEGWRFHS